MNHYDVYEHDTHKRICVLLATSFAEACQIAESHGWHPNKYYIL